MANRLCSIKLSVKDYASKEEGSFIYHGEVVELDYINKIYRYRFYQTDAGTLAVSIDFSKDEVEIKEVNDAVNLSLKLTEKGYSDCIYKFDENNSLILKSKAFGVHIDENQVILDYDLYASTDVNKEHPITRNVVEIICEVNKVC
ncbi:MAG: hypothetical protein PUA56_04225 [Bacillales bacterium]|nr:hypothetical protein [Bacillales bacterium]